MRLFESLFGCYCCGKGKGKKKKTKKEKAPEHRNLKNQPKADQDQLSIKLEEENKELIFSVDDTHQSKSQDHDEIGLPIDRQDEELAELEDHQLIERVQIHLELAAEIQEEKELEGVDQPIIKVQDQVNLAVEEVEYLKLQHLYRSEVKRQHLVIFSEGQEVDELKLDHLQKDEVQVLDCNSFNAVYNWRDPLYDLGLSDLKALGNPPAQCSRTTNDTLSNTGLTTFKWEQLILSDVNVQTEIPNLLPPLYGPSGLNPEFEFTDIHFWRLPHIKVKLDIDFDMDPTNNLKNNQETVEISELAQEFQVKGAKTDLLQKSQQAERDKGIDPTDDIIADSNTCHFLQATGFLKPIEESGPSVSDSRFRPNWSILESNLLEKEVIPSPRLCDTEFSDVQFWRIPLVQLDLDLVLPLDLTTEIKEKNIIKEMSKNAPELPLPVNESMAKLRKLAKPVPQCTIEDQNPSLPSLPCSLLLPGMSCPLPLSEHSRPTDPLQTGHDLISNLNPKELRKTVNEPTLGWSVKYLCSLIEPNLDPCPIFRPSRVNSQENITTALGASSSYADPGTQVHCPEDGINVQSEIHIPQATGFQKPIGECGSQTGAFDKSSACCQSEHSSKDSGLHSLNTGILETYQAEPRSSLFQKFGSAVETVYEEFLGYNETIKCHHNLKEIVADFETAHSERMKEKNQFALPPPISMEELRSMIDPPPLEKTEEQIQHALSYCSCLLPGIDCPGQPSGISFSGIPIEIPSSCPSPVTPYQSSSICSPCPNSLPGIESKLKKRPRKMKKKN